MGIVREVDVARMERRLASVPRRYLLQGPRANTMSATAGAIVVDCGAARDAVWDRWCDTLYYSMVQLRYHKRRQMFFDRIDKTSKALTLLLGATLFGPEIKENLPYVATAISSLSLLSLIFTYGDRKQSHKELAEKFGKLVAAMEKVPPGALTAEKVADWKSQHMELVATAPPPLKRLTLYCAREQTLSMGKPSERQHGLWRNWFFLGKYFL